MRRAAGGVEGAGDRVRSRDAEYPAEELGFEMTASAHSAGLLLDMAANIVTRLPATLAGMAAGVIDRDRARVISNATLHLSDDLAAEADKILADAAPELRLADLQQKAARLEARLDPEGVQERKDDARHDRRVELRREDSGAASLSGRELDPAEAIAGKASIDAEAVRLRNAGLPGTLAQIRAMILLDRIHQRNPWDRLAPLLESEPSAACDGDCDGSDPRYLRRQPRPRSRARSPTKASHPTRTQNPACPTTRTPTTRTTWTLARTGSSRAPVTRTMMRTRAAPPGSTGRRPGRRSTRPAARPPCPP